MMSTKTITPKRTLAGRPHICSLRHVACSRTFFPSETLDEAARLTGFIERKRILTATRMVSTLAFWHGDCLGYGDIAAEIALRHGEDVTKQSVHEKLEGIEAANFFEALTRQALEEGRAFPLRPVVRLNGVGDIFVADSSSITLNKSLAQHLPGTGGNDGAAAIKIHGLINMSRQQFTRLKLTDGTTSDHSEKDAHALILKEGDLLIRDMGYFDLVDLNGLDQGGRFYLTRVPTSTKVFADINGKPIDIWAEIAGSRRFVFDRAIKLGVECFTTRLVALRLPKWKWKQRLADLRKEKRRGLTAVEKAKAKWNLMITNLAPAQASSDTLKIVYAWRWQIELAWKAFKSVLDIDCVKSATCKSVVFAFIWARLLCAVVMMTVRSIAMHVSQKEIGILAWFRRLAPQLGAIRDLLRAEKWLALARLLTKLAFKHCRTEKRHRNSTLEKMRDFGDLGQHSEWRFNP